MPSLLENSGYPGPDYLLSGLRMGQEGHRLPLPTRPRAQGSRTHLPPPVMERGRCSQQAPHRG